MAFQIGKILGNENKFLILLCIVNLLLHLPFMNEPPRSIHVWRQCNTLAMARNFATENMNILEPKVDRRGDGTGVTGSQFPSYEWGLAAVWKITGVNEKLHRWYSFLFYVLCSIAFYRLAKIVFNNKEVAALSCWLFTFSPELFYQGVNALPDVLALGSSVMGLVLFMEWNKERSNTKLLSSFLFCVIGGLTKLQYLAVGFPMLLIGIKSIRKKEYNRIQIIQLIVFAVGAAAIPLSWYQYSVYLIEKSGLKDFGITIKTAPFADAVKIIANNLISDLPELLMGYGSVVLLLIGIYAVIKNKIAKNQYFKPFILWAVVLAIYHYTESFLMDVHQYYMLPHLPLLFLTAGYGLKTLYNKNKMAWVMVFLVVAPLWACLRIIPARWIDGKEGISIDLYNLETRTALSNAIPNNQRIIAGPDESGCIYFYFLNKKGFGFTKVDDLKDTIDGNPAIVNYINRGCYFLYTTESSLEKDSILSTFIHRRLQKHKDFSLYELKL